MKTLFLVSGALSLGIGVVGIVLPVLPTTPFLLLTGFLFAKSNDRYRDWFINTKLYNRYLKEFSEKKEMSFKHKWTLMVFTDAMLLFSFASLESIALRTLIVVLTLIKHYYFYKYVKVV